MQQQQQESSCSTQFAEWCLSSSERKCHVPDHPYSLFEGEVCDDYVMLNNR